MARPPFDGADWQAAIAAYATAALAGGLAGAPQAYGLLQGARATGPAVSPVQGGDYIWRVEGTFDSASVTLQTLGLDGQTWLPLQKSDGSALAVTTAAAVRISVGQGSTVRAAITGGDTATSLFSALAGL